MTHESDAPALAGQLAQTSSDLDAELEEKAAPVRVGVGRRIEDGGEHGQPMVLVGEQRETALLEAGVERAGHVGMALPARRETLSEDEPETGMEGGHHRGGRGVVVRPVVTPVTPDQRQVEVPRLDLV